ncbi:MAG: NERD domain-containing protein, partial [Thiothrix sp.]|nr:NERD domain-containing protein [Thiothrix sp.]
MQLIPATPYQTGSQAEHRLFRKLQEAFYAESHFIAFHSLNLTRHAYKRFSEIDFLLLCPYGLYVLEVKGGGVSHQQGCWYTLDRNRQQHAIQHPFKQAQTALSAVLEKIGSAPDREGLQIASGYGVVFPDVEWQHSGAEWDRELVCDFRRFRDCEKWLQQLFRYWHRKPGNAHCLSAEQIQDLSRFLRPDFEQVESLSARLDHLQHQQVVLTEEQYRYLDIAVANPRVLCSGGAGTGKTLLAAELARRLAAEKCQVLLLCKSGWLRSYLAARILLENVMLSTLDSVVLDSRRAGITRYDVLIVDEGQDLFTWPAMAVMDDWLTGGLADGEWYIF